MKKKLKVAALAMCLLLGVSTTSATAAVTNEEVGAVGGGAVAAGIGQIIWHSTVATVSGGLIGAPLVYIAIKTNGFGLFGPSK